MSSQTPNLPASLRGHSASGEAVVFMPDTGDAITVSEASTDQLAEWRRSAREWVESARSAMRLVDAEILARMDKSASWTIQTRAGKLSSVSPTPVVGWKDVERLRYRLCGMVAEGLIDQAAVDDALPVVPESVAMNTRRLASLAKLDTPVGVAVREHRVESPRESRGVKQS